MLKRLSLDGLLMPLLIFIFSGGGGNEEKKH